MSDVEVWFRHLIRPIMPIDEAANVDMEIDTTEGVN